MGRVHLLVHWHRVRERESVAAMMCTVAYPLLGLAYVQQIYNCNQLG